MVQHAGDLRHRHQPHPEIANFARVDRVIYVVDKDAVRSCQDATAGKDCRCTGVGKPRILLCGLLRDLIANRTIQQIMPEPESLGILDQRRED